MLGYAGGECSEHARCALVKPGLIHEDEAVEPDVVLWNGDTESQGIDRDFSDDRFLRRSGVDIAKIFKQMEWVNARFAYYHLLRFRETYLLSAPGVKRSLIGCSDELLTRGVFSALFPVVPDQLPHPQPYQAKSSPTALPR